MHLFKIFYREAITTKPMPVDNVALYTKNISELSHFFSASNRYQFWLAACLF
jgi:DNA-dependent RNA polymerase auxiliary subunit epsilon